MEHCLKQMLWILTQSREGGYFLMIGKKRNAHEETT
jgi:hypothetical protein